MGKKNPQALLGDSDCSKFAIILLKLHHLGIHQRKYRTLCTTQHR